MTVHVECFGIPRERAGVAQLAVEASTLGELYEALSAQLPGFAKSCLSEGRLKDGFLVNLNGRSFVSEESTPLPNGSSVLILSADPGG